MTDSLYTAAILAFQAPFICLVIGLYVFFTLGRNGYTRREYTCVRLLVLMCLIAMVSEIACGLLYYDIIAHGEHEYIWLSSGAYLAMAANSVIWSEFCLSKSHNVSKKFIIFMRSLYIINGILILCRVIFMNTKLYVYYDNGVLAFGPLDNLQTYASTFIYLILGIALLIKRLDKKEFIYREIHHQLLFADFIILAASVIYGIVFFPYILWIGEMLVILYIYTGNQKASIYSDELTHLYNRRYLIKQINEKIKNGSKWTYIIMDLNSFKSINDTYGHTEGDHALELAADVIGTVAKKNDGTAFRYGGDEFVILHDGNNEETIRQICNLIDEELDRCNEKNNLPYKISASCGYAVYDEKKYMSLPDFLETADKHMYEVKAVKKGISA